MNRTRATFLFKKQEWDINLDFKAFKAHSKEQLVEKTEKQDGNHSMQADSSIIKCENKSSVSFN